MDSIEESVDRMAAESGFAGVVRVDRGGGTEVQRAFGFADRRHRVPNEVDTQFATASGMKTFTALMIISLVVDGVLALDTTARSLLRGDLPLIADDVTIEHLLSHRSGIGDYLDEDGDEYDADEYLMTLPLHTLTEPSAYLPMLDGHPTKFAAGTEFSYCNGGFVVLALLAERATGRPFAELIQQRVLDRAGLHDTALLRSDGLPRRAAVGYVTMDGMQTNVLHLPVVGGGDGGIYTTVGDVHTLWDAFFAGRIVPAEWVTEMTRPRSDAQENTSRYGMGLWLHRTGPGVAMEGADAGVSFRSMCDPQQHVTHTVLSNWSEGAWPIARFLRDTLNPSS